MRTGIRMTARAASIWALAVPLLLLAAGAGRVRADDVPEPPGLWTGPMYGETPPTLSGASVVDADGVAALLAQKPLLLDVGPAPRKPETLPKDRPWLPTHRSLPGATWMPGAGLVPLDAGREALFRRRIDELAGGDKAKPIVVFCQPACWGSWNAGKRLVLQGYTRVHWFPAGIDGWQELHDTAEVQQDAAWSASRPDDR